MTPKTCAIDCLDHDGPQRPGREDAQTERKAVRC
mgnify:CR=1 FL=1